MEAVSIRTVGTERCEISHTLHDTILGLESKRKEIVKAAGSSTDSPDVEILFTYI
jgi:hypothetical protein